MLTMSVIKAFNTAVGPIHQRIVLNGRNFSSLVQARVFLLPRLILGKLRTPDAEKLTEGTGI